MGERSQFFAHTASGGRAWEPLREHLSLVADRARHHAAQFGAGDEAYLAGVLHDLGKYGERFQRRLEGHGSGLDHWTLGAWAALQGARGQGLAAALAIEGHHVGLQIGSRSSRTFERLTPEYFSRYHPPNVQPAEDDVDRALKRFDSDGLTFPKSISSLWDRAMPNPQGMLAVRMLFSTLVDADYLETEAFMRGDTETRRAYRSPGPILDPAQSLRIVLDHVRELESNTTAAENVVRIRSNLQRDCLSASEHDRGTFTLTAPTGSGKTLSMLTFALAHAAAHDLRRVVFAVPFLSLIEQTARTYTDLFDGEGLGDYFVLESHSLAHAIAGPSNRSLPIAGTVGDLGLLTENWDAPIVVTTNVQLLESLFAHRPRRCRKLHNLANSVILFDEVQTLPPELIRPTLSVLGTLVRDFGCSVVFATATQPAFGHLDRAVRRYADKEKTADSIRIGWRPREIVREPRAMFDAVRRTKVAWEVEQTLGWEALAEKMLATEGRALAIVNLKRHARALTEALDRREARGLEHLSTNLCSAHRAEVLARVRRRLRQGEPCLLVSTQCVEAGVDIDFPAVFRALGPLESIAQAAGRCNRSGVLPDGGKVVVFLPEDEGYPPGAYEQASRVTKSLLAETGSLSIDDPETFSVYYQSLYDLTGVASEDDTELESAIRDADFPEVAKLYRLISGDTVQVVVAWEEGLLEELRRGRFNRRWIRRARPFSVSIYRPRLGVLSALEPAPPTSRGETPSNWYLLPDRDGYDRRLYGLTSVDRKLWIA